MLYAFLICALAGCSSDERLQGLERPQAPRGPARPVVSALAAPVGSRIAIAVEAAEGTPVLAAIHGELRFDPAKLTYVGQAPYDSLTFPLVVVNDAGAAQARLRVLSLDPRGLPSRSALLVFEVRASGYAGSLRYSLSEAVTVSLAVVPENPTLTPAVEDAALALPAGAVRLAAKDWAVLERRYLERHPARLIDSVPAGRRYGDADTSGAVTITDAARVSNWAVGNQFPAGQPIPAPGSFAELAGNVAPTNLPGLGESSDTKGPGWDVSCVRTWSVVDGANIANEAVGNDRDVVGELIPADAVDPATGLPRRGSACTPSGSEPPPIPPTSSYPSNPPVVANPAAARFVYYRNLYWVSFSTNATATQINAFLTVYRGSIVGGIGRYSSEPAYAIQVPDPGPTWQAKDSLIQSMRGHPGVASVAHVPFEDTIDLRGRFPLDAGTALNRSSWFSTMNPAIQPYLAIRAPLAWGCETGTYGGATSPIVGVIDNFFDHIPADLAANVTYVLRPSPSSSIPLTAADSGMVSDTAHGIGVASILGARGDDSLGIPGVTWKARVELYAIGRSGTRPTNVLEHLDSLLARAGQRGVQALNVSVAYGDARDSMTVSRLRLALASYLSSGSSRLVVLATGNDGLTLSLNDVALDPSPPARLTALDRAAALLSQEPAYLGKVLFTGGTVARSGARWPDASVWTGGHSIAAPADSVFAPFDAASQGVQLKIGTSFAAPFVAGTAALLLSMEPSLTGQEVTDYILRGAQALRLNPATRAYQAPTDIGVGGVYQVDAYGALTLLSAERAGTPICGYEVTAEPADPTGVVVRLEPPGRPPVAYALPLYPTIGRLSVAQGGRRIAISFSNGPEGAVLNHLGSVLHSVSSGTERQYLERDTADIVSTGQGSRTITLTGPGRGPADANLQPLAGAAYGSQFYLKAIAVSPTGEYVAYGVDGLFPATPCGGYVDQRWFVAPLHGGSPTGIWTFVETPCGYPTPGYGGLPGAIAWNQAGTAVAITPFVLYSDRWDGVIAEWEAQGAVRTYTVPSVVLKHPRYAADNGSIQVYETNPFAFPMCAETRRNRAQGSFGAVVGSPVSVPVALCDNFSKTVQPNVLVRDAMPRRGTGSGNAAGPTEGLPLSKLRVRAN